MARLTGLARRQLPAKNSDTRHRARCECECEVRVRGWGWASGGGWGEFASDTVVSFHPPPSAASQRIPRTTEGAGWGIRFQQDGTILRTGLGGSAFEQSAAPKAMDLFDVSSLVIDKNPDVADPRGFVQGL
jgi:hypothetical protein